MFQSFWDGVRDVWEKLHISKLYYFKPILLHKLSCSKYFAVSGIHNGIFAQLITYTYEIAKVSQHKLMYDELIFIFTYGLEDFR